MVLAPEMDCADASKVAERPRVFHVYVTCYFESGDTCIEPIEMYPHSAVQDLATAVENRFERRYDLQVDDSRVLLSAFKGDGSQFDRIRGLSVKSTGPLPKVSWVVRPEFRKK
jgi:hypothetical protein